MKKEQSQRGFSLIEVVVALLLFSLLMGSLWEFFSNTYSVYNKFDKKTNLSDESRMVSSFIREEVRLADQVTIKVKDATTNVEYTIKPEETFRITGNLEEIILNTTETIGRKQKRKLLLTENPPGAKDKGKFKLDYVANLITSPIADKIENIKVTREENSSIIEFECTLIKNGDIQKVENTFSESLKYKIAVTP